MNGAEVFSVLSSVTPSQDNAPPQTSGEKQTIEYTVEKDGLYVGPTFGTSMLPMLRTGRDSVVIRRKTERLKPLDTALYKRGDSYVLHRVIAVKEDGYVIRGDNCYADENVPESAVFGVLTEFFRGKKHILCTDKKYLRYVGRRIRSYPVRRFFARLKGLCKRIVKKILGVFGVKRGKA